MTGPGPLRNSESVLFPENLNVFRDEVKGNIEIQGNQILCSRRDHSLSDLFYSKTKANFEKLAEIPATTSDHL